MVLFFTIYKLNYNGPVRQYISQPELFLFFSFFLFLTRRGHNSEGLGNWWPFQPIYIDGIYYIV